jgi:bifunctional DNA-binding transcriptional regulator/antitoxin component of YhaV-PrlF toxin-antitoxin module
MRCQNNVVRRITIPKSWRITFGAITPGMREERSNNPKLALRVYETEKKQRAIFTDVLSFMDTSIVVEELPLKKVHKVKVNKDPYDEEYVEEQIRETEWIKVFDDTDLAEEGS